MKATSSPKALSIELKTIRIDGGTQSRAGLHDETVADYADALRAGTTFPPVVIFYDGNTRWLADGFHRYAAAAAAGMKAILAEIRQGSRRDAILHSVGANETHGLRRTNEDKRRAVQTLLDDQEWSKWSDREIARQCQVSQPFVSKLRPITDNVGSERTYTTKHGTTATMDTSAIGKSPIAAAADPASPPEPPEASDPSVTPAPDEAASIRAEIQANKPQALRDADAKKAEAVASRKSGGADVELRDRIEELEEAVKTLEAENAALKAENTMFSEMRVQFEQGGFEKVIAGKDEEIRVLKTRVVRESEDKVSWKRTADMWRRRAEEAGWSNEAVIDIKTGEFVDG
jgi:hypothetical protein